MDILTLCAAVVALRVVPDRSQFFQYESFSLSCGELGNSSEWKIKRNTSLRINEECFNMDKKKESHWFTDALYPSDTGVYWCESAAGERSDAIKITVAVDSVILAGPAGPVMEGDSVTLSCRQETNSSNGTADFYKDGLLIRSSSTGDMTIYNVSRPDEGLYECNISGVGRSPDGWLSVREAECRIPHATSRSSAALFVAVECFFLVLLVSLVSMAIFCFRRSCKNKADSDVSYTDVTIRQEAPRKQVGDLDSAQTFYSTVKPGNT